MSDKRISISLDEYNMLHTETLAQKDTITRLTAEVERLRAALQWRPIETAPKDGTDILVSGGTYSWDTDYGPESPHTWVSLASWREQRWQGENSGGHDEYFFYKPTHWMHLPPPPALSGDKHD